MISNSALWCMINIFQLRVKWIKVLYIRATFFHNEFKLAIQKLRNVFSRSPSVWNHWPTWDFCESWQKFLNHRQQTKLTQVVGPFRTNSSILQFFICDPSFNVIKSFIVSFYEIVQQFFLKNNGFLLKVIHLDLRCK